MRLLRHSTALIAGLLMSASVMAADSYNDYHQDEPGYFAMVGDLVIARPLLLGVTLVGAGAFLVSLPFSALGGNVGEAGDLLASRRSPHAAKVVAQLEGGLGQRSRHGRHTRKPPRSPRLVRGPSPAKASRAPSWRGGGQTTNDAAQRAVTSKPV